MGRAGNLNDIMYLVIVQCKMLYSSVKKYNNYYLYIHNSEKVKEIQKQLKHVTCFSPKQSAPREPLLIILLIQSV